MKTNQLLLPGALIGVGAAAATGFTLLARKVNAHETRHLDASARRQVPKRPRRIPRVAAEVVEPLGKWWGQAPIAATVAAAAWRSRGARAAAPIGAASAGAASLALLAG